MVSTKTRYDKNVQQRVITGSNYESEIATQCERSIKKVNPRIKFKNHSERGKEFLIVLKKAMYTGYFPIPDYKESKFEKYDFSDRTEAKKYLLKQVNDFILYSECFRKCATRKTYNDVLTVFGSVEKYNQAIQKWFDFLYVNNHVRKLMKQFANWAPEYFTFINDPNTLNSTYIDLGGEYFEFYMIVHPFKMFGEKINRIQILTRLKEV